MRSQAAHRFAMGVLDETRALARRLPGPCPDAVVADTRNSRVDAGQFRGGGATRTR